MINNKSVIAIVPAREGSKGLPGKNIRYLCEKPLIAWSIETGLESKYVDMVVVSTDSEEIAGISMRHGAYVPFLRPDTLSGDNASSIDVLLHALDYLASINKVFDYVVLLEPTSPLRDVTDIDGALELLSNQGCTESVVGVARAEVSHPAFLFSVEGGLLRPMLGCQPTGIRRQDLDEEYYYLEGSVYASTVDSLRKTKSFYHERTAPWLVDRYKSIEIDELCDFIIAEALMRSKIEGILK